MLIIKGYRSMQKLVLHFTILLLVFGAAAYKAEHTAALACSLLGECSTIFFLLGKVQVGHFFCMTMLTTLCSRTSYNWLILEQFQDTPLERRLNG